MLFYVNYFLGYYQSEDSIEISDFHWALYSSRHTNRDGTLSKTLKQLAQQPYIAKNSNQSQKNVLTVLGETHSMLYDRMDTTKLEQNTPTSQKFELMVLCVVHYSI